MKACPFNATHIVPEREMKLHFENCGDRHLIEAPKYSCTYFSACIVLFPLLFKLKFFVLFQ